MEEIRYTTPEALTVLNRVLSSIDHEQRAHMAAAERVAVMSDARKLQERFAALACVLTDEVSQSQASVASTGKPITSLIALDEGRDSTDAARQVFQARDVSKHETVKQAALAGAVSSRHAAAIAKAPS